MQYASPLPQYSLSLEGHARPPEAMQAPQVVSRVLMLCDALALGRGRVSH